MTSYFLLLEGDSFLRKKKLRKSILQLLSDWSLFFGITLIRIEDKTVVTLLNNEFSAIKTNDIFGVSSSFLRTFRQMAARRPVRLLVQVTPRSPLTLSDVLEPSAHQHERTLPVGEGPDHSRAAPDLAVELLNGVVGAYAPPVLAGKPRVGQGLRTVGLATGGALVALGADEVVGLLLEQPLSASSTVLWTSSLRSPFRLSSFNVTIGSGMVASCMLLVSTT